MPIKWNCPVSELTPEERAERNAYFVTALGKWKKTHKDAVKQQKARARMRMSSDDWKQRYVRYKETECRCHRRAYVLKKEFLRLSNILLE